MMPQRPNPNSPSSPNLYRQHPGHAQANPDGLIPVTRTESTLVPSPLTASHTRELESIRQLPPGTIVFSCGDPSAAPTLNQPPSNNRLLSLLRGQPKRP